MSLPRPPKRHQRRAHPRVKPVMVPNERLQKPVHPCLSLWQKNKPQPVGDARQKPDARAPRSPARMRACATTSVIALVGVQLAAKHPAGIAGVHEDQRDQGDRAHEHKDLAARSGCSGAPTFPAEEHEGEKPRFEEEGGEHLLGHQRTENRFHEAENTDQFVPNRWDITMPDRTPLANEIAKIFTQRRKRLRYVLSPRHSHRALSTAVAGKPCGQDWKETAPGRREGEVDPCRRSRVEAG